MESSKKALFEDDQSQWHLALGKRSIGPLTTLEVYEMLQKQEISMAHFLWKQGLKNWVRVCEVAPFEELAPQSPGAEVPRASSDRPAVKKAKPRVTQDHYFIFHQGAQTGPFQEAEIERMLRLQKIQGSTQIWKMGFPNWMPIAAVTEFQSAIESANKTTTKPRRQGSPPLQNTSEATETGETVQQDQRSNLRKPLVARIFVSNDQTMVIGICRDISVGGMQVLTDKVPGAVGAKIKLNVSPSDSKEVSPFVAEGEIVRVLDDGLGFSFRFDHLNDDAKKAIQKYISD